jgi:hypothetical protein
MSVFIPAVGSVPGGVKNFVWSVDLLSWVEMTQPGGSGGGGGGLTDAELRADAVLVSVQNWPGYATTAKQDTLFAELQAKADLTETQPVSLASVPTHGVTGTFFQATQPISAAALPLPSGAATEATLLTRTKPADQQHVIVDSSAGIVVSGTVTTTPPSNASTNVAQVGGVAISLNTGVRDTGTQRVTVATNDLVPVSGTVTVTPPTLTKGTQGSTGLSTQDLKDAGRNQTNYFHAAPIITTVAEVMQTLTGYKSGAAVAATATPAVVTSGKTYRIQSIEITYWAATVIGGARVNLRANLSGVGVVGSPLVKSFQVGIPAAFVAGSAETYVFNYPDGIEFAAGTGIAVGVIGEGAVPTTGTIAGYVMVAIQGYEY